jgi:hypothetical protein
MNSTLADAIFWGAVGCCAVAQVAILRALGGARRAGAGAPDLPRPRWLLEVIWAVLPVIALAGVLVVTWRKTHGAARATSTRSYVSAARGARQ